MNLVKTYLDKDQFGGIGLFAAEDIPKGTLMWELIEPFDMVFEKKYFDFLVGRIPEEMRKAYVDRYLYEQNGLVCICGDDARFSNHSRTPNTISTFYTQHALVDIKKGEEIFTNYADINDEFDESEFSELKSFKK